MNGIFRIGVGITLMPEQSCYHFRFKSSYKRLKSARETLQNIFAGRCVRGLAIFQLCALSASEEQPLKGRECLDLFD
ncbi:MAG: hypothetical protein AVDCRST_MAG96-2668 [uncultured Segetibacter sp.]|uniref:Uncharacterized protein n=1 Tax=uncultured Segetibacter sp. TaxID=481133 RepID=A0A6J4T7Z4_9BACT|nr:MAG: hypothetical protein AVDCRST_MAG96-2668 [uncultured Segetibacter sp.]